MKVLQINLDDNEDPESLSVRMTTAEAAFIARLIGYHTETTAEAIMDGIAAAIHEIWTCLSGSFFNRFWGAGLDGVAPQKTGGVR